MVAPISSSKARFSIGKTVMTPGALSAIAGAGQDPAEFLARHQRGDWGDLSEGDKKLNDAACLHEGDVEKQDRTFSSYQTKLNVKIWVITEWDRSVTTLLLPEEY